MADIIARRPTAGNNSGLAVCNNCSHIVICVPRTRRGILTTVRGNRSFFYWVGRKLMQAPMPVADFCGNVLSLLAAMAISAAVLVGCAAPRETITWNAPRETAAPPANPITAPSSDTTTDSTARDRNKALQGAMGKTGSGPCREFQESVMIGGKPQRAYSTACRQTDGTWKRVSSSDRPTTEAPISSFPYQGFPGGYALYSQYYPRHHYGFGNRRHRRYFGYGTRW